MLKLCVGASSGGHMAELQSLLSSSQSWPVQPTVFVATLSDLAQQQGRSERFYIIGECNRHTPLSAIAVLWRSFKIIRRERPHVILTTGSMPLALFGLVGRIFGAHLIWIDSISQVDELSMSGRLVKRFASQFFVQWPALVSKFPGVRYEGELV